MKFEVHEASMGRGEQTQSYVICRSASSCRELTPIPTLCSRPPSLLRCWLPPDAGAPASARGQTSTPTFRQELLNPILGREKGGRRPSQRWHWAPTLAIGSRTSNGPCAISRPCTRSVLISSPTPPSLEWDQKRSTLGVRMRRMRMQMEMLWVWG